jgi:hypothetical protein
LAPQFYCSCRIRHFVRIDANIHHRTRTCEHHQYYLYPQNVSNYTSGQKFVGGGGIGFFAKETTETKKLNAELKTRKIQKAEDERQEKIRAMEGIKTERDPYVC